jgi:hypothetical protein
MELVRAELDVLRVLDHLEVVAGWEIVGVAGLDLEQAAVHEGDAPPTPEQEPPVRAGTRFVGETAVGAGSQGDSCGAAPEVDGVTTEVGQAALAQCA